MRRALAQDFASLLDCRVTMTLDDRLPEEDGPWTIARLRGDDELASFAELAAHHDETLCVAPETSGLLQARAERTIRVGGHSLGCAPEAIALAADKGRLFHHLLAHDVPTPETYPASAVPADLPFPAVLKPNDGAGCLATRYLAGRADLERFSGSLDGLIVQPWVAGRPISVSTIIARGEPIWTGAASQMIVQENGLVGYRGGVAPIAVPRQARELAERVVRSIVGLNGWVGVDMVLSDRAGPVVIEVNPRVTTSYVGLRRLHAPGALAHAMWGGVAPETPSARHVAFTSDGRVFEESR